MEELWWRGGPTWTNYTVKETTKGRGKKKQTVYLATLETDPLKLARLKSNDDLSDLGYVTLDPIIGMDIVLREKSASLRKRFAEHGEAALG